MMRKDPKITRYAAVQENVRYSRRGPIGNSRTQFCGNDR